MNQNKLEIIIKEILILIFSDPIVREGVPQVTHNHTKSSDLYKKIYMKTDIDQGLEDASLQTTLTTDLFLFLQEPWILQSDKISRRGREKENKRL